MATCQGWLGSLLQLKGDAQGARVAFEAEVAEGRRSGDPSLLSGGLYRLATLKRDAGEFHEALDLLADAGTVARQGKLATLCSEVDFAVGVTHLRLGDPMVALRTLEGVDTSCAHPAAVAALPRCIESARVASGGDDTRLLGLLDDVRESPAAWLETAIRAAHAYHRAGRHHDSRSLLVEIRRRLDDAKSLDHTHVILLEDMGFERS